MIAKGILELRKSKGWTQSKLADESGVSRVLISRYEKGTQPSKENLESILKAFHLPKDYFFKKAIDEDHGTDAIDTNFLKRSLNDVLNFSDDDRRIVLSLVTLIKEKRNLEKRINKIKEL
jgi:transcriptional regulator with XRE-family HTH domain